MPPAASSDGTSSSSSSASTASTSSSAACNTPGHDQRMSQEQQMAQGRWQGAGGRGIVVMNIPTQDRLGLSQHPFNIIYGFNLLNFHVYFPDVISFTFSLLADFIKLVSMNVFITTLSCVGSLSHKQVPLHHSFGGMSNIPPAAPVGGFLACAPSHQYFLHTH